jgi:membrane-bound metal-dependent hydrolase YbcI (DUF457 family)
MYAGHFAAGLAIKARVPRAPTWALLLGTGLLDVGFGLFVPLGIERATVTPGQSPGFRLDFIDWSHSIAMALVWSALYGALFWRRGGAVAAAAFLAVLSHCGLDIVMHPADIALWPHSVRHVGLGLWQLLPTGWWLVELAFIAACLAYYVARARGDGSFGGRWIWVCVVVVVLHIANSPWASAWR